jgi:hypothetical protein
MERKQSHLRLALAFFTSISVVLLLLPWSPVEARAASHVETVGGNPTCADFTDGGTQLKIEGGELTAADSGTYSDGTLVVDVVIYATDLGWAFDWSSSYGIDVVVAKGGPMANVYTYDPIALQDTGLHSPVNPSSGDWYGLSHISFCYQVGGPTTTAAPAATTSTTQVATSTTGAKATTTTSTATTIPTEVLPTEVTTSTITAEVLPTAMTTTTLPVEVIAEELPFTGMSGLRLGALGFALLGAGLALVTLRRHAEDTD